MAFKLKDLKVTKVDFVDAGANQQANVLLFKRKTGAGSEGGDEKNDGDVNPIKKFFTAIAKAAGLDIGDTEQVIEQIAKQGATTFGEKIDQVARRRVTSEIWDTCYALEESLCSIICDQEVTDKNGMMKQSVDEFSVVMKGFIDSWAKGDPVEIAKQAHAEYPGRAEEIEIAKSKLELIAKASGTKKEDPTLPATGEFDDTKTTPKKGDPKKKPATQKKSKGEHEDMKIDKSKLTSEECATLEAIEKKAGIDEGSFTDADPVTKSVGEPAVNQEDDIYKGLHPAVAAELKALRKRADDAEAREFEDVAKKYEIIGKKKDELVPLLKSLKGNDQAYNSMIALLDASVEAVNKSGLFVEVGKKGSVGAEGGEAWISIEKRAAEIQKAKPDMTYAQAIDVACQQNPELVQQYEQNR